MQQNTLGATGPHVSEAVFLAAIVESSEDSIVSTGMDGTILIWNQGAERMFGYTAQEAIGRRVTFLFPPEAGHNSASIDKLRRGERIDQYDTVRIRKDGTALDVSVIVSPIRLHSGELVGVSAAYSDITPRKLREIELMKAKEAAEAASRAKSEFLANMSHEIRTPMNGVMGMIELVLDTELHQEQREYLTIAKTSADSMLTVINDILDFSKIEAGRLEIDPIPFNIRDHLEETTKSLAVKAHEKCLELISNVHRDVPEFVIGDVTRLRQVIINLLGNAIKFTAYGEVELRVQLESETPDQLRLHFMVRDTGIGIPVEKQQMIFEAFSQVDGSTTRKYGGTGLGLAISSRLVEAMSGKIWVEQNPGGGSCFHFTALLGVAREIPEEELPVEDVTLAGMRVLLVDDNMTNRRVLADLLVAWKMFPIPAESAQEALALMRRAEMKGDPFELVLTDVHMPETDGFGLVEKIYHTPDLTKPVILMLTSGEHLGDLQRCRSMGVSAYLTKPVRRGELRTAIARALANQTKPAAQPERRRDRSPSTPVLATGAHILLAEDNIVNQRLAKVLLERAGHTVVIAGDGRQALRHLDEQSFDLILMDIQMPELDGFETTAVIRARERDDGKHYCIVAMTAHAMSGDRERCLEAGMDDYLTKPIQSSTLLEMVEKHAPSGHPSPMPV